MCSADQSRLTLCHLIDWGLPGSSVHGMFQAQILEWVAISSSRGSSPPRDPTRISCLLHWQGGSLLLAPPGKYWEQELNSVWPWEDQMTSLSLWVPHFSLENRISVF